ncbi:hypothetical protein DL93DRAFT_2173388 [Clavulina sp. PMI_390]|nr:hypothetical protein DL93DRAFT_2173388 [Clavulina sp. PMI_390]
MFSPASAPRLTRSPPLLALSLASVTFADPITHSPPARSTQTGRHFPFSIKGSTGVSAQQLFLRTENTVSLRLSSSFAKVYVVDKTERNPMTVGGHPA